MALPLNLFCPPSLRKNSFICCAIAAILYAAPVLGQHVAAEPDRPQEKPEKLINLSLDNGFERLFDYTRYRIGGKIISRDGIFYTFFPISELKFPLDVFTIYADLNLIFINRITLHYRVSKNIQNYSGKMKDSDWIYPGFKGIYSES